ncbi:UDP-2,3-diacylglucosamine diphosphatase [Halomonas urumqiensis]|uniref:UDP-2,3-diacylglucosamine hydrolase n=1 Tax=Halomonas urumqiensis TaxID=1684789 RepID=A0A2N7ULS1_9GAMM|nr:UDP-2,3-diacylglucosamine diphosphatase [Halomonas urumqiensis]PMR81387.1 UDP-2,3-diacylglucosamine diphosphatase [Halomonas urumqiensis]PTB01187.1 UDP-2,3-diacylglucosamine diphosphatase [Halomonas urumqiensis]GHE22760.1 UDP-2,3-diacylglucosamine hydrolase [Halomonas urumqiensis]
MTTLLISDLHLNPAAAEITESFLGWLETRARDCDALYILGDFFDAWIGDDLLDLAGSDPTGHADLAVRVAQALNDLAQRGTAIYLMHGNRDFLLGERFAERAGATLLPDPSLVSFGDQPVLLMHGDSLCTRDDAYMAFRAQARDPNWQARILGMPLGERIQLARQLREQSGEANSNKADDIMDVTPDEVVKVMADYGVTTLIHGHTHRPAVHALDIDGKPAQRIVLGDWQPGHGWEIEVGNTGKPELREIWI